MFVWVFLCRLNYSLCVPSLDSHLDRSSICDCNLLKNQHHTRLPSAQIMQNIHFPFLQKSTYRTGQSLGESVLRLQITNHWFCSKWIIIESLVTIVNLAKMSLTQMLTGTVLCTLIVSLVANQFCRSPEAQRQNYLSTRHIKWQDGNIWRGFFCGNSLLHINFLFSFMFQGRCVYRTTRQSSPVCVCVYPDEEKGCVAGGHKLFLISNLMKLFVKSTWESGVFRKKFSRKCFKILEWLYFFAVAWISWCQSD